MSPTHTLFGPRLMPDGVQFRLWAPNAKSVAIEIEGQSPRTMPHNDGWRAITISCAPGTRYAFRVNNVRVPDPASRRQDGGVHGFSVVPRSNYTWRTQGWSGRPWTETILYETHAGLEGGFSKLKARLASLRDLGITAIELMPIAAFPGTRNWGYDGVLPFAPAETYGTEDELKALIDHAHELSLMVFLDVVYNHFGPDGNYLGLYAPEFFRTDIETPWGNAIDFKRAEVRSFFIENALYWINEFRFDGLRLDAVQAIADKSFLVELAHAVRESAPGREIHLVLENDDNDATLLGTAYDAQWNDDFHHVLHVLLTGEAAGYYADYQDNPAERLARILREGFDYQGAFSGHRNRKRGTPSAQLPPSAFVSFLQNHDQTGNRGLGERLTTLADEEALKAALGLLLLSPQIPLLFFGEEVGSKAPFYYFTDHKPKLAQAVRTGRIAEFPFLDPHAIADPNAAETFSQSLPFADAPDGETWRAFIGDLLRLRNKEIIPRLKGARAIEARAHGARAVVAKWQLSGSAVLTIASNFGAQSQPIAPPAGDLIYGRCGETGVPAKSTAAWLAA